MNQPEVTPEPQPEIPEKLSFRTGEASRMVSVQPYVLRYWESEFPALAPNGSGTGHHFYRRKPEVPAKTSRRYRASKTEVRDPAAHRELSFAEPAGWQVTPNESAGILDFLK